MPFAASHRFARISSRKARLVADMIRDKKVDKALAELEFSKKLGATLLTRVLQSAIANADQAEADVRKLYVKAAWVDEGPTMKRFQPKDRGRSYQILKRTSHIHVVVDEKK
jgi:large subunit ribosomal protein L22